MNDNTAFYLRYCIFFTANSLARAATRLADEEFRTLGMSTSHAFLLMLAIEQPGITQKELTGHLNLAQSTVSRFADFLVKKDYLAKEAAGKRVMLYPTSAGKAMLEDINTAWKSLYDRYSDILGKEAGDQLASDTFAAHEKLVEKG